MKPVDCLLAAQEASWKETGLEVSDGIWAAEQKVFPNKMHRVSWRGG